MACSSPRADMAKNMSYLYKDGSPGLRPSIAVYHPKADSSLIRIELRREELLYKTESVGADFRALIQVQWLLRSAVDSRVLDSSLVEYRDFKAGVEGGLLSFEWGLKKPLNEAKAELEIRISDPQRGSMATNTVPLDWEVSGNRQYYRLVDLQGRWVPRPVVLQDRLYRLECGVCPNLIYSRLYTTEYPLATPPFAQNESASFDFNGDSVWGFSLTDTLRFDRVGIYHLQMDSSAMNGFSAFQFGSDFPHLSQRVELAPPLRYLTTKKEYEALTQPADPDSVKFEVDRFWLKMGGSPERARQLIEAYYTRIEEANKKFSSYTPGWRTDRGILYTIYGPPDEVVHEPGRELWFYGNRNSSLVYAFEFIKVNNPFTEQDYALVRLAEHRFGWQQAIAGWRSGRVYGSADIKREQDARDAQLRIQRQPTGIWY